MLARSWQSSGSPAKDIPATFPVCSKLGRAPFLEDDLQARLLMAGALFSGAMMFPASHADSVPTRYKVALSVTQEVDATSAGGAKQRTPVYTPEGGWLHLGTEDIVRETVMAQEAGFQGAKVKVGLARVADDVARLKAVRQAVGDGFEIMVDANQCFTLGEALRRASAYADLGIAWFEEPLPADDLDGHARLAAASAVPIAVGESLYSPGQFADYVQRGAASILQVDVARIGGITPWLKVAHLAECHNLAVAPHFLMALHASLTAAVPAAQWVVYIPQLDAVASSRLAIADGHAVAPDTPGLGIAWRWDEIERRTIDLRRIPT